MGHGGLHRLHDLQRPSPGLTKGGGAATPSDRKLGNLKMMEKNTSTVYIYIVFLKQIIGGIAINIGSIR